MFLVYPHVPEQEQIRGTDAFSPLNHIQNSVRILPRGEISKIVLYCRSGRISEIAAGKLAELGYTNVLNHPGERTMDDRKVWIWDMIKWNMLGNFRPIALLMEKIYSTALNNSSAYLEKKNGHVCYVS